ncbi:hypothetical protein GW819_00280 [Candidatus Gracilibacteria bacterium]|nr:hypothetical protein [bacterium]NDK19261.1 hypothetical protein [Candidatus Gracilibacteria bacterium]OIO75672.1 MAG: hypothetical protein AUJ87_04340 [Candidatus Gracilibacteria bacterium CG1_02_38_174]PIQ10766.1 MAG: hypothetical protein COW68_03765 [Candidatus Gracilibacteria bacterium CG18_big_fil_WC_8_21_14_2_50_38_16]PIQ42038.1 MAG: hypothetical protein COW06_00840 [Candidatus Gracilibacteria bacterium CG12_big_fil_rev_8_21_14_0_65_38_15]PIZ01906.1 MAG: hypothetical protein COY60_0128
MSHIKEYIEKSILIPPEIKESLSNEEVHGALKDDMLCFIETYTPLEQEILGEVNKELEILNAQIKSYLQNKETTMREEEMNKVELEIAYL